MTATNHVLTGALIAVVVPFPVLAIVLAVLSHFALDALPHYSDERMTHADRAFLYVLFSDMLLAFCILLILLITMPNNWLLMISCGILASSPDLMWFGPWLQELKHKQPQPFGIVRRFHQRIQWCTKPWGIGVEFVWAIGAVFLLAKLI